MLLSGDAESETDMYSLTANLNRGGLKFPSACVVTIMHTEVVVQKLLLPENATLFLDMANHRNVVHHLVTESLPDFEELHVCENGHEPDVVVSLIVKCATNIILNNYCKDRNDRAAAAAKADAKERKLRTVAKK